MERVAPEGVPLNKFIILVQDGGIDSLEFVRFEKEVAEHDRTEPGDSLGELGIGVEFRGESTNLRFQFRINGFAALPALF